MVVAGPVAAGPQWAEMEVEEAADAVLAWKEPVVASCSPAEVPCTSALMGSHLVRVENRSFAEEDKERSKAADHKREAGMKVRGSLAPGYPTVVYRSEAVVEGTQTAVQARSTAEVAEGMQAAHSCERAAGFGTVVAPLLLAAVLQETQCQ